MSLTRADGNEAPEKRLVEESDAMLRLMPEAAARALIVQIARGRRKMPGGLFANIPRTDMVEMCRRYCVAQGWSFSEVPRGDHE